MAATHTYTEQHNPQVWSPNAVDIQLGWGYCKNHIDYTHTHTHICTDVHTSERENALAHTSRWVGGVYVCTLSIDNQKGVGGVGGCAVRLRENEKGPHILVRTTAAHPVFNENIEPFSTMSFNQKYFKLCRAHSVYLFACGRCVLFACSFK